MIAFEANVLDRSGDSPHQPVVKVIFPAAIGDLSGHSHHINLQSRSNNIISQDEVPIAFCCGVTR